MKIIPSVIGDCLPNPSRRGGPPIAALLRNGSEDQMANKNLSGKRVAILATDGVEEVELTEPRDALRQAGATAQVVSPKSGTIKAWQHDHWGNEIPVDVEL